MTGKREGLEPWQEELVKAEEARRKGIEPWMRDMIDATPDSLLRDIVRDNRRPASLPGIAGEPVKPGGGWVETKAADRRNEIKLVDAMVNAMIGGPNDTSKLK